MHCAGEWPAITGSEAENKPEPYNSGFFGILISAQSNHDVPQHPRDTQISLKQKWSKERNEKSHWGRQCSG